jgi:hypothetical protein
MGLYAVQAGRSVNVENYASRLKQTYGPNAEAIGAYYPASAYSSAVSALGHRMVGINKKVVDAP